MKQLYDPTAPKKPTNLSINSDLLEKIRKTDINLSATLEQALTQQLAEIKTKTWAKRNKASIKAYNSFVEKNGCFSDEHRPF